LTNCSTYVIITPEANEFVNSSSSVPYIGLSKLTLRNKKKSLIIHCSYNTSNLTEYFQVLSGIRSQTSSPAQIHDTSAAVFSPSRRWKVGLIYLKRLEFRCYQKWRHQHPFHRPFDVQWIRWSLMRNKWSRLCSLSWYHYTLHQRCCSTPKIYHHSLDKYMYIFKAKHTFIATESFSEDINLHDTLAKSQV
jgi:hypothetical protein